MALSVNSNPHKILIIDDEPLNILALCAVLKSRGYQTVKAATAKEGLHKLFDDDSISIILMDMMMPEIDGYEATALIRGNKNIGNIPIIAVTAQAMAHDKEKCLAAGINDYVSKPIDIDILTRVIKKYIK
ncbi:MAG TPA: response regulator [Pseudosphingobacterium sp.]|nr:response regulator [Pseudosphingobacterium sp.]